MNGCRSNIEAELVGTAQPAPGLPRRAALAAVKLVHTAAWFSIESCMVYVLWAGFRRQSGRRAAVAAGVVATETLIFASTCPAGSPTTSPRSTSP